MRSKGIALVTALIAILLVAGISALIVARTLSELQHSRDDYTIVRALMLARGGANAVGARMTSDIRSELRTIVKQNSDTTAPWAFGDDTGKGYPDPVSTAQDLETVASQLQQRVDALLCNFTPKPDGAKGSVKVRVYFTNTACGKTLPANVKLGTPRYVSGPPRLGSAAASAQTYALPFVLISEGSFGAYRRNIVLQGEYRFTIGRGSFARYALFTNVHALPNGTNVWFTNRTLFDGPVHTNGHFRFYRKPWFGGEVTSAGCTNPGDTRCQGQIYPGARFYGEGFVRDVNMRPDPSHPSYANYYGVHEPQFQNGVDWRASFVRLPVNNDAQRSAARASGLYVNRTIQKLKLFTAEEEGKTYQYINLRVCTRGRWVWRWNPNRWQWVQTLRCTETQTLAYRYASDRILQYYDAHDDVWKNVIRNGDTVRFNGVIFSEGAIKNLTGPGRTDPNDPSTAKPALAPFAQITVAAERTIKIGGDLKYSDRPCETPPKRNQDGSVTPAVCNNLEAQNVLGVYSQNGDVLIRSDAPRDLNIDGVLMSARGVVQVEDYDSIPEKGNVYLTGGIIEYYYGAFGTFNPNTGRNGTGYGRRFTYDRRMQQGLAPPFFPTTQLDDVTSVSLFSYGQREQVY